MMTDKDVKSNIKQYLEQNQDASADDFVEYFADKHSVFDFLSKNNLIQKLIFDNIKNIPEFAFSDCSNLPKVIKFPMLESVELDAFMGDISVEEIELGSNLRYLGPGSFQEMSALQKVTIAEGVDSIGASCFEGCINLKEVYLPESVTLIRLDSFKDCPEDFKIITPKHNIKLYDNELKNHIIYR